MADANYTDPANHPLPGTGPGPPGVPGGTDRSYSVDIMVCAVLTATISFTLVALRFYVRLYIVRVLHWEDWLLLLAQAGPRSEAEVLRLHSDMHNRRSSQPLCVAASFMVRLSPLVTKITIEMIFVLEHPANAIPIPEAVLGHGTHAWLVPWENITPMAKVPSLVSISPLANIPPRRPGTRFSSTNSVYGAPKSPSSSCTTASGTTPTSEAPPKPSSSLS